MMVDTYLKSCFVALGVFSMATSAFAQSSLKNVKSELKTNAELRLNSKEDFSIKCLPILQNPTQDGITISWSTTKPAMSWVEIAPDDGSHFYFKQRPKYYEAPLGRKKISTLHNVKISGLDKNTKYRYRIYSQEVKGGADTQIKFGEIASSNVYKVDAMTFKTLDPDQKNVKFFIINDIHQDVGRLKNLLSKVDLSSCDFIFLNGDLVNFMPSFDNFNKHFLNALADSANGHVPIYFLRGNHETRGLNAQNITELFPTESGMTYYTFNIGPVAFLALDTGEDKPDSDIEYYGNNDFDSFRTIEAKWLKNAVSKKSFKDAPVKIAFAHMPLGINDRAPWHGMVDAKTKFSPILNQSAIDVVFSGHIHRHAKYDADKNGLNIPNIANSNLEIMEVNINPSEINIKAIDLDGKVCHEYSYKPKSTK